MHGFFTVRYDTYTFPTLPMALAESFLRKVHKLGLVPKLIRLLPAILAGLALVLVAWMVSLPLAGNYRNTYISENALMPAQVTSYFRESEWNIVRGFRAQIRNLDFERTRENNLLVDLWLQDMGLKTAYHHNVKRPNDPDTLYAIMHAPRGDDTEAMVVAVPWFTGSGEPNISGVSVGVALARYFGRMSIWSKNIIFVFPSSGHAPLRAWVEAYHTTLSDTAGSIDAAIVMEYEGELDYFDYYEVDYEGLNGQLPNLDLLNTANTIAYHENLQCSVQNTPQSELSTNLYAARLRVLLRGLANLLLAGLSKHSTGCEAFSGWQIQAFTLRAMQTAGLDRHADVTQFGRIVDSSLRSVNNLLEKFHQSFFFYLLLAPKHFVSIGTYLPATVLLAVSFAVSFLGCLLNSGVYLSVYVGHIAKLLTAFTLVELGCFFVAVAFPYVTLANPDLENAISFAVVAFFGSVAVLAALLPVIKNAFRLLLLSRTQSYGLMALSLLFVAMLITTLMIVHFALALAIGLLALPLTFVPPLVTASAKNPALMTKNGLKIGASLLISNPFVVLCAVGTFYTGYKDGVVGLMRGLLTSWEELQCWTWFVVVLGWLPAWTGVAIGCNFGDFSEDLRTKKEQ